MRPGGARVAWPLAKLGFQGGFVYRTPVRSHFKYLSIWLSTRGHGRVQEPKINGALELILRAEARAGDELRFLGRFTSEHQVAAIAVMRPGEVCSDASHFLSNGALP